MTMQRGPLPGGIRVPEPRNDVRHPLADHFESLRRNRDQRRAVPGGARKRRAAITIVHNEPVFFPIWLGYYSQFFAAEDIYVLDHESDDGSTARDGFVRIPVTHETVDHTWMVRTIEALQHELLQRYDVVLVTDVDEIVAPVPEFGTLGDYIDGLEEDFVNCLGYELIHLVDREPPFDRARNVLDQRGYWFPSDIYDKPALATVPMRWHPGFHRGLEGSMHPDPDLYLIHLHRMDYEICLARHSHRQRLDWNERDVSLGWATHNRITDEAEFAQWFYEESNAEWNKIAIEPIPPPWRGAF
jgi:Glycosyl transferase family 2